MSSAAWSFATWTSSSLVMGHLSRIGSMEPFGQYEIGGRSGERSRLDLGGPRQHLAGKAVEELEELAHAPGADVEVERDVREAVVGEALEIAEDLVGRAGEDRPRLAAG